jgi:hypothetical protein
MYTEIKYLRMLVNDTEMNLRFYNRWRFLFQLAGYEFLINDSTLRSCFSPNLDFYK